MPELQTQVQARITEERKALYADAADRLGVSISDLIRSALDQVAGKIRTSGWEARTVHLAGNRIVSVGEVVPDSDGLPLPTSSFVLLAPRRFWEAVEHAIDNGES